MNKKYTENQIEKEREFLAENWRYDNDEALTDDIEAIAKKAGFTHFNIEKDLDFDFSFSQGDYVGLNGRTKYFMGSKGIYSRGKQNEMERFYVRSTHNGHDFYTQMSGEKCYWLGHETFKEMYDTITKAEAEIMKILKDRYWNDVYGDGIYDPAVDSLNNQDEFEPKPTPPLEELKIILNAMKFHADEEDNAAVVDLIPDAIEALEAFDKA